MSELIVRGLSKRFAAVEALRAVDLTLPGGYVCVMGESGSGKTTLLRIIAGLERADAGSVIIDGVVLDDLPPERRPTRTVFQTPALFPQLDVLANVGFAARLRPREGTRKHARDLLAEVGLDPDIYAARSPEALSGGERQRVALARALFELPAWLLLDEPLSALDRPRRADLRRTLAALQREHGCAVLHVTHDPEEALALADHLVVMGEGRVLASGEPAALYARAPNLETARLLGELVALPQGWIRPERLELVAAEDPRARVPARLLAQRSVGDRWRLELALASESEPVTIVAPDAWPRLESCALWWDDGDLMHFAPAE